MEGEADTVFNEAISKLSRNNQDFMNNIENIAADTENGNIFLIGGTASAEGIEIYCITKEGENFKYYSGNLSGVKVKAAAAYNGTLFLAGMKDNSTTLLAYKTELQTQNNMLVLATHGTTGIATISPEGQSGTTDCNDIHADDTGVYVLLSSTSLKGNIYSVGQINSYKYDYNNGLFGTNVKTAGRTSAQLENGGIAFVDNEKGYYANFSKPVAFTGWNNDYLYIADDGINIEYKKASENCRVDGNKNRIATFFKGDNKLDFHFANISSDTTWYEEHSAYKQPNTPVLSWEKGTHGMKYWTSADGIEDFSDKNKLWESDKPNIKPLDIFCYDQDGNLYIFYKNDNYNKVKQFELNDGSYVSTNESFATLDNEPTAIAVDISNGKNCLYYAYETSSTNECFIIKKYKSGTPSVVTKIGDAGTTITALAANKDGLFAAIKNVDTANTYTLTVKKYNKENGVVSGSVNVVQNEPSETSPDPNPSGLQYEYNSAINALQINNGILYGIMSKEKRTKKSVRVCDFNNGSSLYDLGKTKESLSKLKKPIEKNYDDVNHIGYGFYRFIAVKENNLVIASDGAAWIADPPLNATEKNCNKVLFVYDLGNKEITTTEEDSDCNFSKELALDVSLSLQWK